VATLARNLTSNRLETIRQPVWDTVFIFGTVVLRLSCIWRRWTCGGLGGGGISAALRDGLERLRRNQPTIPGRGGEGGVGNGMSDDKWGVSMCVVVVIEWDNDFEWGVY
jgi:hypothetical protein